MVQAAALGLAAPARALLAWQQAQRPATLNRGFNETEGIFSVPRFVGFWVRAPSLMRLVCAVVVSITDAASMVLGHVLGSELQH